MPVEKVRGKLNEIVKSTPLWDGRVVALQVTDATECTIELRALASARTAPEAFDLRCLIGEKLIAYLAREFPNSLPQRREQVIDSGMHEPGREGREIETRLARALSGLRLPTRAADD